MLIARSPVVRCARLLLPVFDELVMAYSLSLPHSVPLTSPVEVFAVSDFVSRSDSVILPVLEAMFTDFSHVTA